MIKIIKPNCVENPVYSPKKERSDGWSWASKQDVVGRRPHTAKFVPNAIDVYNGKKQLAAVVLIVVEEMLTTLSLS